MNKHSIHAEYLAALKCEPDRPAIISEVGSWAYREVVSISWAYVRAIEALSLPPAARVAVYTYNSPHAIALLLACSFGGYTYVPLNNSSSHDELKYVLSHSNSSVVFVPDDEHAAVMERLSNAPVIKFLYFAKDSDIKEATSCARSVHNTDYLISYTSGSTGTPKAVVHDENGLVMAARAFKASWGLSQSDRVIMALPQGWLYGLYTASLMPLLCGSQVKIIRKFRPPDVIAALFDGASVFMGVPTMYSMMLNYIEDNDIDLKAVKPPLLISAGAPLQIDLKTRFRRATGWGIENYYALSEALPILTFGRGEADTAPAAAVGKVSPGAEILVVDHDGRPVSSNEIGEMLAKSPATFLRYDGDAKTTRDAFINGWVRTGDLARMDHDAYVYIEGRSKDLIIKGGANVAPVEVEGVLTRHHQVSQAAVIGRADTTYGEEIIAYVEISGTIDAESLRVFCADHLSGFKIPKEIHFLEQLPLGPTGKVDKKMLQRIDQDKIGAAA